MHIPNDVWRIVCDLLGEEWRLTCPWKLTLAGRKASLHSLMNVSQVSQALRDFLRPHLYNQFPGQDIANPELFFRTIAVDTTLARYVRTVHFDALDDDALSPETNVSEIIAQIPRSTLPDYEGGAFDLHPARIGRPRFWNLLVNLGYLAHFVNQRHQSFRGDPPLQFLREIVFSAQAYTSTVEEILGPFAVLDLYARLESLLPRVETLHLERLDCQTGLTAGHEGEASLLPVPALTSVTFTSCRIVGSFLRSLLGANPNLRDLHIIRDATAQSWGPISEHETAVMVATIFERGRELEELTLDLLNFEIPSSAVLFSAMPAGTLIERMMVSATARRGFEAIGLAHMKLQRLRIDAIALLGEAGSADNTGVAPVNGEMLAHLPATLDRLEISRVKRKAAAGLNDQIQKYMKDRFCDGCEQWHGAVRIGRPSSRHRVAKEEVDGPDHDEDNVTMIYEYSDDEA